MESRGEKIKRLRATDPFDNRMGFQIIRPKQDQTDKKNHCSFANRWVDIAELGIYPVDTFLAYHNSTLRKYVASCF